MLLTGVSYLPPRLYPCVPRPHQVSMARADISRHIWQEDSLVKNSCLPENLQDKASKMAVRLTAAGGTHTRTSSSSHPLAASQDTQAVKSEFWECDEAPKAEFLSLCLTSGNSLQTKREYTFSSFQTCGYDSLCANGWIHLISKEKISAPCFALCNITVICLFNLHRGFGILGISQKASKLCPGTNSVIWSMWLKTRLPTISHSHCPWSHRMGWATFCFSEVKAVPFISEYSVLQGICYYRPLSICMFQES